jgi:DNA-binding transcriptional LysR family regulator
MLLSIPTVLVGAPGYNGATAAPATPNDLAFHNCLSLSRTQGQDRWRFRGANGELAINVTGTLHANNLEALRFAVLRGLGIAVLPHELVREDLGAGRLVRMLPDHASLDWALVATTASDAPPAARVRAVLDFLTHAFQDTEAQPIADRAA